MVFASSTRKANRTRWKGIDAKPSVVPQLPLFARLWDRIKWNRYQMVYRVCTDSGIQCTYSRLSLSRLRLSRITAYLEEKI